MLEGGLLLAAAIGLVALLPLVFRGMPALAMRLAMVAVAFVLFALTHADRFASLPDIAIMAAVAAGILAFMLRSPETDRVPGIEAALTKSEAAARFEVSRLVGADRRSHAVSVLQRSFPRPWAGLM